MHVASSFIGNILGYPCSQYRRVAKHLSYAQLLTHAPYFMSERAKLQSLLLALKVQVSQRSRASDSALNTEYTSESEIT
jgi:hypothetical protein